MKPVDGDTANGYFIIFSYLCKAKRTLYFSVVTSFTMRTLVYSEREGASLIFSDINAFWYTYYCGSLTKPVMVTTIDSFIRI